MSQIPREHFARGGATPLGAAGEQYRTGTHGHIAQQQQQQQHTTNGLQVRGEHGEQPVAVVVDGRAGINAIGLKGGD